jgi:hypothetical protein
VSAEALAAETEALAAALRNDWDEVRRQIREEFLPGELERFHYVAFGLCDEISRERDRRRAPGRSR